MSIKPKYWSERQAKLNAQLEKDETKLNAKLEKEYSSIEAELEKEIGAYYSKYGKDNVIEYRKLLLELPEADKELLYKKMDAFAEKYPEYAHLMPVRESIYKLNRLEGLEHDIYINQCKVGAITEKELKNHLEKLALKSYLAAGGRNLLNVYAIEKLVNKKWLDGGNFSTRIWGNVDLVANHLQNEFRNSIIRGDAYERNIEAMMRKFRVNRSNARRLIYTEGTFVMNEASMTAFEGDYERYKYAALMDSKTSSICRHLNGKVFKIKDREAGINFPPMHPNCRSSYTIVIDEDNIARGNADNKNDESLANTSVKQHENLNNSDENDIIKESKYLQWLSSKDIERKPVNKLDTPREHQEIINYIAGKDKTGGSCTSQALAYIGNVAGYDVKDYRGGASMDFFAAPYNISDMLNIKGVKGETLIGEDEFAIANKLYKNMEDSKEYLFSIGEHTAIIRKNGRNKEFLELQYSFGNGYQKLDKKILKDRFKCKKKRDILKQRDATIIEIDTIKDKKEFAEILKYINTID